jgi:signal transduction histidine kinase
MTQSNPFNHYLFRQIYRFEWGVIVICGVMEALVYLYTKPNPTTPDLRASIIFLCILAILSIAAPTKGSYWDRFCFLLLELLLITGAVATGLTRFLFPLYVVVVAKACILLDRKGMLAICALDILCSLVFAAFKLHSATPDMFKSGVTLDNVLSLIAQAVLYMYVLCVLVILTAILVQSAQKEKESREEAEGLHGTVRDLATELERGRIAREIHDSLGHTLVSLNLQLDIARKLQQREPERADEALKIAKELAAQSLTDVRMAVESIRAASDFKLPEAVNELVASLKQSGTAVDVQLNLEVNNIPATVGYQVFRVLQECLTNVVKHAQASSVRIALVQSKEKLDLEVQDDGKGLGDPSTTQGFGIRGMRERVELMHGTVSIRSQDKGTCVHVSIPLVQSSATHQALPS